MKKQLALALVLCMIMMLAACGGGEQPAASPSEGAPASVSGSSSEEGPVEESSAFRVDGDVTLKVAIYKHTLDTGISLEKDIIQKSMEETGLKFEIIDIPTSDWSTKVNLMFATGDMPDMFIGNNIDIAAFNDQLHPLEDLIAQHAPTVQQYIDDNPALSVALTYSDGHIYSMPSGTESQGANEVAGFLWYSSSMLADAGLQAPATVDELYNVLNDIKAAYSDVIPLSFCEASWASKFVQLLAPWGIISYTQPSVSNDGTVRFDGTDEALYDALIYYNRLVGEGLLDVESFTQTEEQYRSKGTNGQLFMGIHTRSQLTVGDEKMDDYGYLYPPAGPDGTTFWQSRDPLALYTKACVVTTSCENPEIAVKWIEYCNASMDMRLTTYYGYVDNYWQYDDDGLWMTSGPVWDSGYETNYQWICGFVGAGPAFLSANDSLQQAEYNKALDTQIKQALIDECRENGALMDENQFFPRAYEDPESAERRSELDTEMSAYMSEFVANAVINGIDEAAWQQHLTRLESLDIDEWVELYTNLYATYSPFA